MKFLLFTSKHFGWHLVRFWQNLARSQQFRALVQVVISTNKHFHTISVACSSVDLREGQRSLGLHNSGSRFQINIEHFLTCVKNSVTFTWYELKLDGDLLELIYQWRLLKSIACFQYAVFSRISCINTGMFWVKETHTLYNMYNMFVTYKCSIHRSLDAQLLV